MYCTETCVYFTTPVFRVGLYFKYIYYILVNTLNISTTTLDGYRSTNTTARFIIGNQLKQIVNQLNEDVSGNPF